MDQQGLKQPLLGILGLIVVLFISFGIMVWFKTETFLTWAGTLAMCTIPFSVVAGLVWQGNYPPPAAKLEQPLKGLYLLLMTMIVGALVGAWSLKTVGGFMTPPTPFLILFIINSVIMTFFCVVAFQCWPATALKGDHPGFIGLFTVIIAYALDWVVFKIFFNFGFAKGAPWYSPALDPGGIYMAFVVLSFLITALALMLIWVLFDFWPLSLIPPKAPAFGKQPIWGITVTILLFIGASIVQSICVRTLEMDVVVFMVRVPICTLFGIFIMLLLMQTWPMQTAKQPGKGIVLTILAIILNVVMYEIYAWASTLGWGALPAGPPGYVFELWVATALLGFTFPVIAMYTGYFNFWPLTEPKPQSK